MTSYCVSCGRLADIDPGELYCPRCSRAREDDSVELMTAITAVQMRASEAKEINEEADDR